QLVDFVAFYCAGSVFASGADPYTLEPLRSCENHAFLIPANSFLVFPAPLPSYDLSLFSLIAAIPFPVARILWEILLGLSFGATTIIVARLTKIKPLFIFTALYFSDAIVSLYFGQLVPISLAALSTAMLCLSRERFGLAAFCVTLSLIEPHIGLGPWVSLFLFAPRSRFALLTCLVGLLLVSASHHGFSDDITYVRNILPAHIASEVHNDEQLSLTHLGTLLGMAQNSALLLGKLSFALFLILGLLCARETARRTGNLAFLIVIPPAFTLIGGPFIHIHQMAVALPAAFFLFAQAPRLRHLIGPAIFLLAIPWNDFLVLAWCLPLVAIATILLSRYFLHASVPVQALLAIITIAVVSSGILLFKFPPHATLPLQEILANAPAERVWEDYIEKTFTSNTLLFLVLALPTWVGLLLTASCSFRLAFSKVT
ncbi:MAG TPA: glycosyltransferase 87 family protein, partial [Candidatus Baltobacteraceae bacterium]|nr:glycosyltransferase 87 family protein [Candidatus Baltobacteraceae bacterium]